MNKIKFIPVLALTALLAGCSLFDGKAPKFADAGEEVEYSYFYDQCMAEIRDSEISDQDVKLTDRVVKYSSYYMQKNVLKRDNKEISKTENTTSRKSESQYDVDNAVGKITAENKLSYKGNGPEGSGSYSTTEKRENYYQFEKESGIKYLIYANAKTKEYNRQEQVTSSRKQDDIFDDLIRAELVSMVSDFYNYVPSSFGNAKDCLFYIKDNSLFTISKTKEETIKNSDYNLVAKTKLKVQINTTDKKQSLKISSEVQNEYVYLKNGSSVREKDVVTENIVNYVEYIFTGKTVNLSAIDASDYYLRSSI